MADRTDPSGTASRLEAALDRIAHAATRAPSVEYVTGAADPEGATREQELADLVVERERQLAEAQAIQERLAARVDSLIAELRGVLADEK